MFDLIIKNGLIVDGSGLPAFAGDVAISDGRIRKIGKLNAPAKHSVDAQGKVIAPGFIDPHTHFDAQLLWDGACKPAVEHGVTTVVPGNCSLSLAPLKAEHRNKLVGMFNQIEEMPLKAFDVGVEWDWETFAEFVERLERDLTINVAPLVGHSVLRLWVMGDAAMERAATPEEVTQLQALLRECLEAGAVGLSTSFIDMDETLKPVPSRYADAAELDALAAVLGEYGRMLQIVHEFFDADVSVARVDALANLSLKHGIPTTLSPVLVNTNDTIVTDKIMARVREHVAMGARVWPQVQTRPIDISFSFEVPSLLFIRMRGWYAIMRHGTHDDIVKAFSDPERRPELVREAASMNSMWEQLVLRQVQTANNQALVGMKLVDIAANRNTGIVDTMIDLSLEEDLQAHFLFADMGHSDAQKVAALLRDPLVHIGASDSGAHIMSFATFGDTGYLFSKFVRDEASMSLESAVKKVTYDVANIWGLPERGLLQEGYVADITIFDPDTVDRGPEYYVQDVPGEGSRYVRDAIGIDTVIIGGEIAYQQQAGYTGSKRGQVLPGATRRIESQ
jgi:N-acyl-D-aspartate/D-glutamate deacylase